MYERVETLQQVDEEELKEASPTIEIPDLEEENSQDSEKSESKESEGKSDSEKISQKSSIEDEKD